jgi:hypothetical protein
MLAALEQTAVPLAMKPGQAPSPEIMLPALRRALSGELARTLGVAAPDATVAERPYPGRAPRAAARRPADALDRLIANAAGDDAEEAP